MNRNRLRMAVTALSLFLMVALTAGCGSSTSSTASTSTASASSTGSETNGTNATSTAPSSAVTSASSSPETSATSQASSTSSPDSASATASSTPVTPASALVVDGEPAEQVSIPAPGLNIIYAVTKKGLYRQQANAGWVKVSSDTDGDAPILSDPTQPNILFQGNHQPCGKGGPSVPLRKSVDGGQTWTTISGANDIQPLAVDSASVGHVFGNNCQLAVSLDGGSTWSIERLVPNYNLTSLAIVGTDIYGVYTSEGGTSQLEEIDMSDPTNPQLEGPPLLKFWGGGVVFATLDTIVVGESHGVHISADQGQTWSFSRSGLEPVTTSVDPLTTPIPKEETARGFGIFAVATDPAHPKQLYLGTIAGVYVSSDGGATWSRDASVPAERVEALAFSMQYQALYVTTKKGVLVAQP